MEGDQNIRKDLINYNGRYSKDWSDGYVLLNCALRNNLTEIAKLLLANGFEVNSTSLTDTTTPLHYATRNGDIEIVKMLLDKGAHINAKNEFDKTPLYIAIEFKKIEITKLLLTHGADANLKDKMGSSPLQLATQAGYTEIIEYLLEYEANVNYTCTLYKNIPTDYSPLHWATMNNDQKIITLFLNNGANINIRGIDNITPLYIASDRNYKDTVVLFLNRGADINAVTNNHLTPLHIAIRKGHVPVVKLLLKHGYIVDDQDAYGKTILYRAVEAGNSMVVQNVLNYRPDLNNKSNIESLKIAVNGQGREYQMIVNALLEYGFRINVNDAELLHIAIIGGHLKIVEILLKHGANVNYLYNSTYEKDFTPLHNAANNKHKEIGKLLISYGADINARDNRGKTPLYYAVKNADFKFVKLLLTDKTQVKDDNELLHIAVQNFNIEIVETLMQYGVDINASDELGRTALHFTAVTKIQDCFKLTTNENFVINIMGAIAKLLLSNGANVDAQTKYGLTTLHAAAERGYLNVAQALLEHDADINICDINGKTALHFTTLNETEEFFKGRPIKDIDMDIKAEIAKMLLNKGADVDTHTNEGLTALHIATERGCTKIVETLLEYDANINCRTRNGFTPLHIAAKKGFHEIVEIILKFDADINSVNECGKTALYIASVRYHEDVVTTLLEYGSDFNVIPVNDRIFLVPTLNEINFFNDFVDDDFNYNLDCYCLLSEEIANIYKRHVIKLNAANLYVNQRNLQLARSDDMSEFKAECENEVANMMCEKIDIKISYYDILVKHTSLLATYMKNENIVQILKSKNYETIFPIYAGIIKCPFIKAMQMKEFREKSNEIVYFLFHNRPELPYDCIEKIVSYLNKEDIKALFDACNPNQEIRQSLKRINYL